MKFRLILESINSDPSHRSGPQLRLLPAVILPPITPVFMPPALDFTSGPAAAHIYLRDPDHRPVATLTFDWSQYGVYFQPPGSTWIKMDTRERLTTLPSGCEKDNALLGQMLDLMIEKTQDLPGDPGKQAPWLVNTRMLCE